MTKNKNYRGNRNLLNPNSTHSYTADEIKELAKCAKNPIYFIKNYVKIVNVDLGVIQFDLRNYQEKMILAIHNNRKVIVKASRQSGKSSACAAYYLWCLIFMPNYSIAVMANKLNTAREIIDRIQNSLEQLPTFMKPQIKHFNKLSFEFTNGSKIMSGATSASAVRGLSFNLIHLDEYAFIPTNIADAFFSSVYPTISSGTTTKMVIVSTPQGMNGFYKMWSQAEKGRNGFIPISFTWKDVPGRDEAWRLKTIAESSESLFEQEHNCDFLGSSNTLIGSSFIKNMVDDIPIKQSKTLNIYADPIKGHFYVMICDPSQGTGRDNSAIIIFDVTNYPIKIVAIFKDNTISPLILPTVINDLGKIYNNAHALVENNNNGAEVINILHRDFEYDNIVSPGGFHSDRQGVRTNKSVKKLGCIIFKDLVENHKLIINDLELISEISTFVQKKQSYEADDGCKDDIVMCAVLFAWFTTMDEFKYIADMDLRAEILKQKEQYLNDEVMPFGFILSQNYDAEDNAPLKMDGDVWHFQGDWKH